jgi:hypothetical protein
MIAQLIPYAADSKSATAELSALAQEAGGPTTDNIQVLSKWVDQGHDSISNLQDIINTATEKMANMASVAQNLGTVMSTDIIDQMDRAKLSVYNVTQATANYTQSLEANGSQSSVTHDKYSQLVQILTDVTGNNKEANTIAQTYARSLGDDSEKAVTAAADTNKYSEALRGIPGVEETQIRAQLRAHWSVAELIAGGAPIGHAAIRAARGMMVPGEGDQDSVLAMLTPGEAVIPKHLVRRIVPLLKALGIPGFQQGGSVDTDVAGAAQAVTAGGTNQATTMANDVGQAIQSQLSSAMLSMTAGAATGQVVTWLMQALKDTHTTTSWLPGLEIIAAHESSDNPYAVNLWDSNAAAGDPSRGLMQVIMTTFDAYHQAGTSWNIFNPVANAAAAINYIKARYGTVWNVPGVIAVEQGRPYVGYRNGGFIPPFGVGTLGESGPETVQAGPFGAMVTPGAGKCTNVTQNYFGPQMPSPEQLMKMRMDLTLALGVAP